MEDFSEEKGKDEKVERMRVCFISHTSGKGGAERALLELIDALKERCVKCYVVLPAHGPLVEELDKRGITYCILPFKWWMSKKSLKQEQMVKAVLNLITVIPLALRIEQWKCDVVYTNSITVCVGALAAKLLRLPHVWHIHEFGYEDFGLVFDLGLKDSLWLINNYSSICIANSYAVAQKYKRYINPAKLRVVYQSVSVPEDVLVGKSVGIMSDRKKCVIVGALHEGKRQEDAIRAIGELVQRGMEVELYVVGAGDMQYQRYLYDLVTKSGLEGYVKFTGYTENPFQFMLMADVVLMCSRYEAFGRVTVEAMKLGKPVIGARSGGTVELIRDGFNGLLYTPGDYKELAEKIGYLLEHSDIARQLGENALQWATKRFTKDQFGEEILAILEEVRKSKQK